MCLNGKCVSEHENAIDYGDGSFLRRTGSAEIQTFVQDASSTQRTWWNQITTPSTTTTLSPALAIKTTMPWWKRLQQKTIKQRQDTEKTTLAPTSPATLSTTTITTTTTTTPPPPPKTTTTKKTTTTTKKSFKTLRTVSKTKKSDVVEINTLGSSEVCEDRITNIAGSMSCKAFLRSFAYQYCRHKYIKKNCCSSHLRFCSGSTHGR